MSTSRSQVPHINFTKTNEAVCGHESKHHVQSQSHRICDCPGSGPVWPRCLHTKGNSAEGSNPSYHFYRSLHRHRRHRERCDVDAKAAGGRGKTVPLARFLGDQLVAGGFAPGDIVGGEVGGEGYLIATYRGASSDKSILISDHIDVVEALEKDWECPPFKPLVENGYTFGRDVEDVKFDVAAVIVTLKRLKTEGFKPATDNVLVLSGDEETASARYS